jgi:hypothetical protein
MDMSPRQQRALEAVLQRATIDTDFRQQLLTTPHRAIREVFGVTVPNSFRLKFIERDENVDALIVLPDLDEPSCGPANEYDLDHVTGGGGGGEPPPPEWDPGDDDGP